MDRSIPIPLRSNSINDSTTPNSPLSMSLSASSGVGSLDSSISPPIPILSGPPSRKKSLGGDGSGSHIVISRPRPRRRLSTTSSSSVAYSMESSSAAYSVDSSSIGSSEGTEEIFEEEDQRTKNSDKYSVFKNIRRVDNSYKGWSKEVLGLGPLGWSEEILEGGYESTDSAFSSSSGASDEGHPNPPAHPNNNNPFLHSMTPSINNKHVLLPQ
eukprot:TRINITY_DN3656_c0_g1_i1.p1 TRINITY_DN3656_c0_g1~~TRINITY_DN3656_c0_g1_i1.p1  ORF type:complete len:213 (-),score=76.26 TRINITY_DN3656_c0_g1_i1:523-1161(-)